MISSIADDKLGDKYKDIMHHEGDLIRVNNLDIFPSGIERLRKDLGKMLLPKYGYQNESLNEELKLLNNGYELDNGEIGSLYYDTSSDNFIVMKDNEPISIINGNKFRNESLTEEIVEGDEQFYKADDGCFYKFLDKKTVTDEDGWLNDYCLYMKATPEGDHLQVSFVCVYGDEDLYRPEDGYYDFECDTIQEAQEWFDSYGNEDVVDDYYEPELTSDDMNAGQWYESLTLEEMVNKFETNHIDEGYYDLKNLYEATNQNMTAQEKQELKNIISSTNDPQTVQDFLKSKYEKDDKKFNEDIEDEDDPEDEFGHY